SRAAPRAAAAVRGARAARPPRSGTRPAAARRPGRSRRSGTRRRRPPRRAGAARRSRARAARGDRPDSSRAPRTRARSARRVRRQRRSCAGSLPLESIPVSPFEQLPPLLRTAVPGPRSRALAARLAEVESRNVTCVEPTPPVFWERASGCNVWDVDGNRYVDLTAGFGVANVGHAHPRVVEAVQDPAERLPHARGGGHPAGGKGARCEARARPSPGGAA